MLEQSVVEIVPTVCVIIVAAFFGIRLLGYGLPYVFWGLRSILVALEWVLLKTLWLAGWIVYVATILGVIALVLLGLAIVFYHLTIPEKRRLLFLRLFGSTSPLPPVITTRTILGAASCIPSLALFFVISPRFALPLAMIWPVLVIGGLCGYITLGPLDRLARAWLAGRGTEAPMNKNKGM